MSAGIRAELLAAVRNLQDEVARRLDQGETADLFFSAPAREPAPAAGPHVPLAELAAEASACTRCVLSRGRRHVVFGEGSPDADLVFVGEAPGAEEDKEGRPFVGAAGQLLTKIIASIGLTREQVYICNVLKCRPPGNRNPAEEEIRACAPFLERQLALLHPKIICALGTFASQTLLGRTDPIGRLRGQTFAYHGIPVIPTYHPAALLYHPQNKRPVWEDMKRIAVYLGLSLGAATSKTD